MNNQKIIAYAIAYLENKIEQHENFLNNFNGDKESLAQFQLVKKYKKELKELEYMQVKENE